jgi:hypothetical protein
MYLKKWGGKGLQKKKKLQIQQFTRVAFADDFFEVVEINENYERQSFFYLAQVVRFDFSPEADIFKSDAAVRAGYAF